MTGSIQSTVSYKRFKRIFHQLISIGIAREQAVEILRLIHRTIDECKGYHYEKVAAAADRALEAVIQETADSEHLPIIPQLSEDEEDCCIITAAIRCNAMDKNDVISSIKEWYGGHSIGMSDLKVSTQEVPSQ
jgi:hypothetical protein